jgi:hypothetical protein
MKEALLGLRSDGFAQLLTAEAAAGYPILRKERSKAAQSSLEAARKSFE